ncbi:RAMP superfamily protein [Aetokthonos hydrillicola Thurmond2011]|jgi:CRISPR-associated protein Cmr6|uniref:RAMP superfamily protein n=1 Tax=Aetokthonos hydrillicola Thurmond2011 TaxID=2712845 RepID=A0AAP5IB58_9CYAN|nr:RAMP superfamily protein [Aetokthonos hydrillicola]MBO3460356.1 RAMP superfamily protein [Aetokthonos hydrillicola CCALA 1050]MBW4588378.1 RAMP superfamily protein [Aetokthonos hydrillicola CCALA 1050]MDR9896488.1 RAMP superfamily protein [Aetokthonos hydrillicola Thurmond2011]
MAIPDAAKKVPMLFRAQVNGRCQIQRLVPGAEEQDATRWASEWVEKTYPQLPEVPEFVQTRVYRLTWRFITNSGQDDGVIRPVIGAKGWPFYPGSSMKGIFRRACTKEQRDSETLLPLADRYCGKSVNGDFQPGILRFHGGYPTDTTWTENLVDIVHPQQDWQVKSNNKDSGAFIQISLHQPELRFGISSNVLLDDSEWETIWNIWEKALSTGIGSRVCAGYGQPEKHTGNVLYRTRLKGQGQAAKLIDGTGEFRANIFRAAVRGHALRIFGGLTGASTADTIVNRLFGGIQGEAIIGLLGMSFQVLKDKPGSFGRGGYIQPTYDIEGELTWLLAKQLPNPEQEEALKKLIAALTRFAMVFGGFGKSWRRADHRLFFEEYYEDEYKSLIGCHWQWLGERSQLNDVQVRNIDQVGGFINKVRQTAQEWMQLQGITPNPSQKAPWREVWHPDNVQVWGREAESNEDSQAIFWLHEPYQEEIRGIQPEGSIYRTSITGQIGRIGRLWHRMYPFVRLVKNPENGKPMPKTTPKYLEFLTIFPDNSPESNKFIQFLNSQKNRSGAFQKLW